MLEEEAGVRLEEGTVRELRRCVLGGEWEQLHKLVPRLQLSAEQQQQVAVLVLEPQFLELLEAGNIPQAVKVLRQELAPKHPDPKRLNKLSTCVPSACVCCPELVSIAGC